MAGNSKKKAEVKKSAVAGKKTASKKKGATEQKKSGITVGEEVFLWLVLALSIVIFISNLGYGGVIGSAVSTFLFGLFGFMAYLLPFVLILTVAFNISNRGNHIAWVKTVAIVALWLCFCALAELIVNGNDTERQILDFYRESADLKSGGGLIGGLIARPLGTGLGIAGAYAVLIILAIICVVLITEKSLFTGMRKGGSRVYQNARQDADIRREKAAIRKEKRQLEKKRRLEEERNQLHEEQERLHIEPRMEHKVSGVSLDTLLAPPDGDRMSEEVFGVAEEPVKYGGEAEFTEITPSEAEKLTEPSAEAAEESRHKKRRPSKAERDESAKSVAEEIEAVTDDQPQGYAFPPINLLEKPGNVRIGDSANEIRNTKTKLQNTLHNFGVEVSVDNVSCGPTVTRYELTPKQGVKVSRILSLSDDIKLSLAAADIRIEAPIPGKSAVGIEVPNKKNSTVMLRELLESEDFKKKESKLAFAVGKDIGGKVVVTDIAKMPHLLIAGATGSGKSVCINTIIMSILYKARPDEVKLIMIDPKVVELSVYNGIPHLLIPVVTDPKKAAGALNWGVAEMTDRYKKFADFNVRDLKGYNEKVETMQVAEGEEKPEKMPQIVIIVDELADLMMVASKEVEESICRLAQLARAAGIHLIIATQRPSVNVITGLIKANMPSRIAFAVSSGVDSRTIIDMNGAEKLLGKGDMLFYPQGYPKPARMQCAFVSDKEVGNVVEFLSQQNSGEESYSREIEEHISKTPLIAEESEVNEEVDVHFAEAGRFIIEKDKASIGMLQRVYKIGFNRAARIMDQLSDAGVVGPEEGTKPRKILMTMEEFENYLNGKSG